MFIRSPLVSPQRAVATLVVLATTLAGARAQDPEKANAPASEANPAVPAAGHSLHGEAFNEGPRQQAVLLPGMGAVHFPVTAAEPQAQAFVEQGVAQLHTFYYLEAERSFRQAARIDPGCVMAYWGMAMANTNNARRARAFLQEAQKRAKDAQLSRREQLYLDALAARYKDGGNDKGRRQEALQGLETIVQEFPDDLDARAWLAMTTWENSTRGDGIGSRQAVEELLVSVERVAPMHPGMHHYRIHLWDGVKPVLATKSAALYAEAAPGIAHAWHMPGHTYTGLRRYADAAYQQEGSARVDHAAMTRDRIMPFEIHNYAHNNQWFATSASHVGRVHDAIAVARNLVEQPRDPDKNNKNDGGSPQRSGRVRWSELLVRFELWDDLVAATESGALDWSDLPIEQKERAYTLGLAYAGKHDAAKLGEQIEALKALGTRPRDESKDKDEAEPEDNKAEEKDAQNNERGRRRRSVPGLDAALAELEGHALWLDGKHDEALKRIEAASSMRVEARARFQLAAGKPDLAETTIRDAVRGDDQQLPPRLCLVEVLHAAGKDKEAQEEYVKLLPLAREADRDVPAWRRIDAILDNWRSACGWTPPEVSATPSADGPRRIDLSTLGPLGWEPYAAESFTLPDADGTPWSLAEHRGRNVVLIFFLGGQCAHCMQQLQVFGKEIEALKALDADLVAVGTDDAEATRVLIANSDEVRFTMPILPDPGLATFKRYRCHDDFEGAPLHGTFLIDAEGKVRYQRIGADPFLNVEFVKDELARINRLTRDTHNVSPSPSPIAH
jgi:peroxiredoxin/tetratricopeptide (TPR) repeat protein